MIQAVQTQPLVEPAPYLEDVADGPEKAGAWWVRAADNTRIRVGYWPGGTKGTILMFPGRTEYIEKYGRMARDMAALGYGMAAIDWRGQGLADRPAHRRDMGHVRSFDEYRQDVVAVRHVLDQISPPKPWYLIGHSMGGAIGLRALHDGLPVDRAVFTAPMWGIQMSPFMRSISGLVMGLSGPLGFDTRFAPTTGPAEIMAFDNNPLTSDRDNFDYMWRQVKAYPDLALGGPSIRWVSAALDETTALLERPAPDVPALTILGELEQIVAPEAIKHRMARWPGGRLDIIKGAEHEVLMEAPAIRDGILTSITDWFDGAG
ncbi:alpha/beta hydrolase [Rhodophyticola sp. CCM32]|uniref:alpha/beta fold hydrolase n=1 Tax=Rhodophyticola sp. CCM32 TaxID=2916397 RepID=UPI00107F84EC|nr:alpha/beta hydrolase [Rhodophyticola sp. CCM32]QBY00199.1 alpha/beta hydrolase [Rhodophyticola sp. CCM32]